MTRILVVDDHRSQAEEFGVLLRNAGCDVTLAGNGREAMDLLRRDLPDIVLTDLDMPVMDGLELVQAIRRDYPALPVILMTAMGSEDVAARALHQGAASYVRKRSLAREVVRTVGSVLAVARALPQQERVLDCLTDGQLGFVLDNDPAQVPPLLGYLEQVASLLHPRDRTERIRVGIALNEALLNAIQHGNLELELRPSPGGRGGLSGPRRGAATAAALPGPAGPRPGHAVPLGGRLRRGGRGARLRPRHGARPHGPGQPRADRWAGPDAHPHLHG